MRFYKPTEILVVLSVVFGLSLQYDCTEYKYGDCHPGPNCDNWKNCRTDCCDGGYFLDDRYCDGVEDCRKGQDEENCPNYHFKSKLTKCLRPKKNCMKDSECCSGSCKDGKCWDELCG